MGEIYIWKRTLGWVGHSLALSGPHSPARHRADGLSGLHPIGLGSVPMREGLVLTQPCAQCHPAPLTPLASMSQPAAMGREVGWLSKSGVRRGMALCGLGKYWQWQKAGEVLLQENYHLFDSRGFRKELNSCVRIHST